MEIRDLIIVGGGPAGLSAAVNAGGEIRYSGNPSVSMAVHNGGSVRRGD